MSNNVKKELGNGLFSNIGIIFICLLLIFVGAANCYGVKLTAKPSLNPFSTIDEDGNIYIVWEGYKGSEGVYYKYYNSSTDTWSSDILIANGYCRNPKIVVNNGNIYVAWENNDTGEWKIYFEEIDRQGNNLTNLLYINSSDSLANLDFTLKDDVLHFVWEQNDSVYLNKHEIANSSLTPVILVDRLFRWMHIFWVKHEDGNTEIYYTYIAPVSHDSDGDGLYDSIEEGLTNFSSSTYNDADPSTTTNHSNIDSDGDGLPDGWIDGWYYNSSSNSWGVNYSRRDGIKQVWEGEDLNLNGKTEANETSPLNNDSDGDGLPDGWETWYGLDALNASGINGANGDLDGDGLSNIHEYGNGTSPVNNDGDGDGLSDGYEVEHGINPLSKDSDNDGLEDGEENFLNDVDNDGLISPLDKDSDNDGVIDGREYYLKLPNITVTPFNNTDNDWRINMLDSDSDNDGLSDGFEFSNGNKPWRPANYDSDGDGLSDGMEVNGFDIQINGHWITAHTDPDSSDTDKDGLTDGYLEGGELIRRGSFPSYYYVGKSNPMLNDTDGDGLLDGIEVKGWPTYGNRLSYSNPLKNDTDRDGISDYLEYVYNYDASSGDTDSDGLPDAYEDKNKNGLVDENETSPLDPDSDRDGYPDGDEFLNFTHPLNKDTDGDGLIDSLEQNLVTFRTNAVDCNNGRTMETSADGSTSGVRVFEIGCVASEITEVTANMRVQHSRLLFSTEYAWQQAPGPHLCGWVKVNFNITDDNYFVVNYYMFSDPTVELTQQCDTSNTQNGNCSVYDLGQIINVTYYYREMENKTLEYVPSTSYYISFGKVYCTLPNGSTIVLNDIQYTYANYFMGHIKNEIVTGHSFKSGETFYASYVCGPEIDYNSIENFGTWIAVALTPVSDLLYAKKWNGDWVKDSEIHGISVACTPEGYPVYYNSTNGYLIIDVPGNKNPVYKRSAPPTALIGRAPIYSYKSNKQESYTNIFNYDPGNRDTNNDGLLDSENRDILKLKYSNTGDKDNDNISDWIDRDCDNDGILNGEEAFWNKDTDGDGLLNAFDNDSDDDGKLDSEEVKVIFRASRNGMCNFISLPNVPWHVKYCYNSYSATSIALYNSSSDSLDEFFCDYILTYNSSNLSLSLVNYTFLGNPTPITTPEDYYIYKDNNNPSYVYIDIPDGYGDFSPSESLSEGTKLIRCSKVSGYISTNRSLDQSYASNHLETYDFTWALTAGSVDNDNDKLPTNGFGPDPNDSNPDMDEDGLKDGYERNWSSDTDGDGLININDVDSDNDGLPDGWIDGWCYNKTKALNHEHALGTIDGYGVWCSKDGVKQAWEGEDLNLNGRVDCGESDPLKSDSDGDGLSDADEKIVYHTSPVSIDTDDDYLSDVEEIFNCYQVDKIFVPDYVNESDVEKFYNSWVAYYSYPLTLQIQIPYRGEYRISTSPSLANITISNDTFSSTGVFVTTLNANLTPGIYNLTTTTHPGNAIEYILIEKKGCNATNNDTDGDGIVDGLEAGSPLDKDSDNDGLLDNEEQLVSVIDIFGHTWTRGYRSSPTKLDTDGDGISDRYDKRPYNTYDTPEFSDLYPKNSIVVNRTFRGWGLDGVSWIEHLYGTEYRGREDVKVSTMTNESKVRSMIKRALPKNVWGEDIYRVESIDVPSTFDYDPASTPSYDFEATPIEGTPVYHIRYYFVHNDYEAMLVNDFDVYRSPEGKLCYHSENCPTKMKYLLFNIPVELNRDQYLIFAYSLDPEDDEYYYVNESTYSLPAFEYKIYYNTKNNKGFSSNKMHYSLIADEGVSIAKPIERTPTRHAYSIRIPIKEDIATQEKLYLYLSPIYIVKPGGLEYKDSNGVKHVGDGLSEYDVKYLPMNTDSFKIGYIERVIPEYVYKAITKLNDNISYIDEILPSNLSDYATGSYIFGSYPNYKSVDIYNGEPKNFNLDDTILQDDVIVIISKTEASVNKIINMINFTGEWYYNTTNQFNETIKSKQFKSITEIKSLHSYYSKLIWLSLDLPDTLDIHREANVTIIKINPDQDEYNYTVTNTYTIETTGLLGAKRVVKKKHVISDLTNNIDDVGPNNQVFQEFKDNFKNEPSYSLLTTDWRGVAVIVPQNPEQTIFKTISCYFDIGSQVIGYGMTAYDTFDNIRDLTKIVKTTEEVSKAKLIKEFMGPGSPGITDAIGFAITGIDLALTWANAYQAKDKFVTQAAMEHTAADIMDVGLSVAGMVFPPTFVVMPTWYATYYASKGIMYVFGIKEGEYFYKASPGFDSVVFAYEVFSGVTMPSDFAQDAFRDAEKKIKCYVNNTCYINEKELPDSMLGNIKVSPYYPTFYIDPR